MALDRYNKNQVKKNTNSREPKNFERNCLNVSNKNTLNAGNCVIIAKLISSFLKGCIFEHFGHDCSKPGETGSYLTILIALLFQRVQLYNEFCFYFLPNHHHPRIDQLKNLEIPLSSKDVLVNNREGLKISWFPAVNIFFTWFLSYLSLVKSN